MTKKLKFMANVTIMLLAYTGIWSCFDTILFLQNGPMTYPAQQLSLDTVGEYTINNFGAPPARYLFAKF